MPETGFLTDVIFILLAAIVAVALFRRLGLGAIVGYLLAGAVIGPSGLSLVSEPETTRAVAELGVVFLLFTVGLELPLQRVRLMRGRTFALGAVQVVVTALAIGGVAMLAGLDARAAFVVGTALALSSTAIVLRLLVDRRELTSRIGRSAFTVLLTQDVAVGPLLVCVVALGAGGDLGTALGLAALKAVLAVVAIVGGGRLLLRYAVRPVTRVPDPEVFAALTLLIVLASGWLTQMAGLSMGFGAVLAGMLLADTAYRHQVAAEIQPFRGLLLGLFFMTVGMSVDLELTGQRAGMLLGLGAALLAGKALLLFALARLFGAPTALAARLALLLPQAGEFAFVLLGAAITAGVLDAAEGDLLLVLAGLTMMAAPLLARLGLGAARRLERTAVIDAEAVAEESEALAGHVVIAGFGRVGRAVAHRLVETGRAYIAVDLDAHNIFEARHRGMPVYYGDATRPEILTALNVGEAAGLVVAVDEPQAALRLVALVHYIFPELPIYARARDEAHAAELERAGADVVIPELTATGLRLANVVAVADGVQPQDTTPAPQTGKT